MIAPVGTLALPGVDPTAATGATSGTTGTSGAKGFGDILSSKLQDLNTQQVAGENAENSVATGTSTDIAQTMLQVEQASTSLEMVTQVRNKAIEAYQSILQMQI